MTFPMAEIGTPSGVQLSSVPLCVKKTFIEVAEDHVPAMRVSSLPPSLRLAGNHKLRTRASSRCASPTKGSSASEEDEEVSTEADTSGAEDTTSEVEVSFPAEEDKVSALAPCEPCQPQRGRLNSQAKAWSPMAASVVPQQISWQHMEFNRQLKGIAAAVKAVLVNCLYVAAVEASENHLGLSVIAQISPRDSQQKETILTLAKQGIVSATEVSAPLYILGYRARPFAVTAGGFIARFAGVEDEHNACWGLLEHGFCRYGESCRWRHPSYHTTISVTVVVAKK